MDMVEACCHNTTASGGTDLPLWWTSTAVASFLRADLVVTIISMPIRHLENLRRLGQPGATGSRCPLPCLSATHCRGGRSPEWWDKAGSLYGGLLYSSRHPGFSVINILNLVIAEVPKRLLQGQHNDTLIHPCINLGDWMEQSI